MSIPRVWHSPSAKPQPAVDTLGAACEMRFCLMVKTTPDSLIHSGDGGAGKGGRGRALGVGSVSSFEIQTSSRERAVYTANRMGTVALPVPCVPSGSQVPATTLSQACLHHPPQPQCPQAEMPYPCSRGGLQIVLGSESTKDLVVKASLRLVAVSRASLRCRIWHAALLTVTLNERWGKAAVLRGLLLLHSHGPQGCSPSA